MKKSILALSTLLAGSAFAGTMGEVSSRSLFSPYLAGEASWTSPQINQPGYNAYTITQTKQGWGGRLGAGVLYPAGGLGSALSLIPQLDRLAFSAEIGGGYYGQVNSTITNATGGVQQTATHNIDGYDVLAGALYKFEHDKLYHADIFFQFGFMVENLRNNTKTNYANGANPLVTGSQSVYDILSTAYPEVRVGGLYDLTENVAFSVAYLHVFGETYASNTSVQVASGVTRLGGNIQRQVPTLDSVLFGLRYNFV